MICRRFMTLYLSRVIVFVRNFLPYYLIFISLLIYSLWFTLLLNFLNKPRFFFFFWKLIILKLILIILGHRREILLRFLSLASLFFLRILIWHIYASMALTMTPDTLFIKRTSLFSIYQRSFNLLFDTKHHTLFSFSPFFMVVVTTLLRRLYLWSFNYYLFLLNFVDPLQLTWFRIISNSNSYPNYLGFKIALLRQRILISKLRPSDWLCGISFSTFFMCYVISN